MLSYQHAYHAGNMADVHKHSLLAVALDYLAQKDKPLTYIETHAGRGLYRLDDPAARKTGEAARGIGAVEATFPQDHPLAKVLARTRAIHGPAAYPGSPLIARGLLRPGDSLHLAELHPQEYDALHKVMGRSARLHRVDGPALALSLAPPEPRRGLCLIDPSWELKDEWTALPRFVAKLHRAWPVGVLMLWMPLLASGLHQEGLAAVTQVLPGAMVHRIGFAPARPGHGMIGSAMVLVNPPFGISAELDRLSALFPWPATSPR
jgi:23S rRNA (adenine2030-N6)-methyltransferase